MHKWANQYFLGLHFSSIFIPFLTRGFVTVSAGIRQLLAGFIPFNPILNPDKIPMPSLRGGEVDEAIHFTDIVERKWIAMAPTGASQ